MARKTRTSKSFAIFAIVMVVALVVGSLVVFGGAVFGSDPNEPPDQEDEAQQQIAALETEVATNPGDAGAAANLASIYVNQGNIAGAIPLYERATMERPDDGNLRLAFGIALLRGGNILDARVQLERAMELMPDNAGPPYYLGQLEQIREEPDEDAAREWYERAIEVDPNSTLAGQARNRLEELDATATPVP